MVNTKDSPDTELWSPTSVTRVGLCWLVCVLGYQVRTTVVH